MVGGGECDRKDGGELPVYICEWLHLKAWIVRGAGGKRRSLPPGCCRYKEWLYAGGEDLVSEEGKNALYEYRGYPVCHTEKEKRRCACGDGYAPQFHRVAWHEHLFSETSHTEKVC